MRYGYNDPELVQESGLSAPAKVIGFILATLFLTGIWLALDQKLLFGEEWISETYDTIDWRTNEGDLPTYGAWDFETHVWKTHYILKYFPNFQWNPFWYLGMPLLKYYQLGFYAVNILFIVLTGMSPQQSALYLTIFGHLLATLLTFLLCYKLSRKIVVSALASSFLLSNTFISLRSYGWEPITVVFLFLYPLGLLFFFRDPLNPFRPSVLVTLAAAYLSHPLLWFSLCMAMGLYLASIAVRGRFRDERAAYGHYIWQYAVLVLFSMAIGAIQFVPQITYHQVTSGAHMGVTYLPYYQVPFNIIKLTNFMFDAGNLKGPGPVVMITFLFLLSFTFLEWKNKEKEKWWNHDIAGGLALVLFFMVLFYYLELFSIFPMNFLRSIQYHRIIPEFIVTASATIAVLSNTIRTPLQKVFFYSTLIAFVIASGIIVHSVQGHWETIDDLRQKPEFLGNVNVSGRISMPYTDQSLSVRNSYTEIPQVYGYYEQGITNAYTDELFSVSSGYHNADLTILYLKAANIGRLYTNTEAGKRDFIVRSRLNNTLEFKHRRGERYGYFDIPIYDSSFVQAVSSEKADEVQKLKPGCRIMFQVEYCGSEREEFVGRDIAEVSYLREYVAMLEEDYPADASMRMAHPEHFIIEVTNADSDTDIIVKMNLDDDFKATIGSPDGEEVLMEAIGPDFIRLMPGEQAGQQENYAIHLVYQTSWEIKVGAVITVISIIAAALIFISRGRLKKPTALRFRKGDM